MQVGAAGSRFSENGVELDHIPWLFVPVPLTHLLLCYVSYVPAGYYNDLWSFWPIPIPFFLSACLAMTRVRHLSRLFTFRGYLHSGWVPNRLNDSVFSGYPSDVTSAMTGSHRADSAKIVQMSRGSKYRSQEDRVCTHCTMQHESIFIQLDKPTDCLNFCVPVVLHAV